MSERTANYQLEDRREKGSTYSEYIGDGFVVHPDAPPLLFDGFSHHVVSEDGTHAAAWGYDQGKYTLLRDGMPVFETERDDMKVVAQTDDLSRLVVSGGGEVHFIDDSGKSVQLVREKGAFVLGSGDLGNIWISTAAGRFLSKKTTFEHLEMSDIRSHVELNYFQINGEALFPEGIGQNRDGSALLWTQDGSRKRAYVNDKQIESGRTLHVEASDDLSTVLTISYDNDDSWTRVRMYDFKDYLDKQRRDVHSSDARYISHTTNDGVSRVAINLAIGGRKFLVFIADRRVVESKYFDRLTSVKIHDDGTIVAKIVRDGTDRELRFGGPVKKHNDGGNHPPQIEESATTAA